MLTFNLADIIDLLIFNFFMDSANINVAQAFRNYRLEFCETNRYSKRRCSEED